MECSGPASVVFDKTLTEYDFGPSHPMSPLRPECFDIKTRYEEEFAGKGERIKYLRFRFRD